jgi:hypothetical protein
LNARELVGKTTNIYCKETQSEYTAVKLEQDNYATNWSNVVSYKSYIIYDML